MTSSDREPDQGKSLGAGAEAAEGIHALQQDDAGGASAGDATHRSGASDVSTRGASADDDAGSEPLPRTREHVGGYGGAGGAPRTSSDTREPGGARGDETRGAAGGRADRTPDEPGPPINPT